MCAGAVSTRAVRPDAFAHRQAQMPRDQGIGRRLSERVAVVLEPFAHFEDIPVPLGGEQAELRALALQQRIGRDGGAVNDALGRAEERGPVDAERFGDQLQSGEHADGLILWGRGRFRGRDPSAVVDGDEVGERASDVDADSVAIHCGQVLKPMDPCVRGNDLRSTALSADAPAHAGMTRLPIPGPRPPRWTPTDAGMTAPLQPWRHERWNGSPHRSSLRMHASWYRSGNKGGTPTIRAPARG